jgi:hypothetical protein
LWEWQLLSEAFNEEDLAVPLDRLNAADLLKLKADFQQVLKTCPVTNVREISGPHAAAIRRFLAEKGWATIVKTDDDVGDLAKRCGLVVSAYLTGSRAGHGTMLIIHDPQGRPVGRPIAKSSGVSHDKVQKLFKFPLGTKKNIAAAMYLERGGATTEEVNREVGDPKLNLLNEVKKLGYRVEKTKERSPTTGRMVIRYKILA